MNNRKWYSRIWFFPVALLYDELLLRFFSGDGMFPHFSCVLFTAIGAGLVCAGVTYLFQKRQRHAAAVFLALLSVLFSLEAVIRNVFTTYIAPHNLMAGAKNAAEGYTSEFIRSIVYSVPRILLLCAPFIIYLIYSKKFAPQIAIPKKRSADWKRVLAPLVIGLGILIPTAYVTAGGVNGALYGPAFDYSKATDTFGLLTSTRLGLKYEVMGNQEENAFSFAELPADRELPQAVPASVAEAVEKTDSVAAEAAVTPIPMMDTYTFEAVESAVESVPESSVESVVESIVESVPEQRITVEVEPVLEVPAESASDSIAESTVESVVESIPESAVESVAESIPESIVESVPEEQPTVEVESVLEVPVESIPESTVESVPESVVESVPESVVESVPESVVESIPEEPESYGLNVMDIDFTAAENSDSESVRSLTAYIESTQPTSKNAYTGLFEGKNLIMICAESFSGSFVSEELTPTLYRLIHNGIYMSDYYQPEWGGSTTTGEVSFVLGLGPNNGNESMIDTAGHNNYFTMGNQLQRLGYSSAAFHAGDVNYYSRNLTHENLGYNQFLANQNGLGDIVGSIYARDSAVIDKTTPLYIDQQPFSVYYMTGSGHAPYEGSSPLVEKYYDRVNAIVGDSYAEKTKYYICYQMELEEALTLLVQRLEEAGIEDNTVIALVGDHYPYGLGSGAAWGNDQDYISDLIKGNSRVPYEEDKSNAIIWCGSLEHADKAMATEVSTPVYSLDILPTLSNLFGLTFDSRLLPGRDIFSEAEPIVMWNNLSWVTNYGKYNSREEVFYPNEGYADDPDYVATTAAYVQNKLIMSRLLISTDYYRILFGEDDVKEAGQILYQPVG